MIFEYRDLGNKPFDQRFVEMAAISYGMLFAPQIVWDPLDDNAKKNLADYHPDFTDERLPELLLHYKGRNFPRALSESEAAKWEEYRRKRLERLVPDFLKELSMVYECDEFVGEELKLYFESLFDTDY